MLPELPVTDALPALLNTLSDGRNAVLVAPPGAGKTTLVPLNLLDAPWRGRGCDRDARAAPASHPRRGHPHGVAAR